MEALRRPAVTLAGAVGGHCVRLAASNGSFLRTRGAPFFSHGTSFAGTTRARLIIAAHGGGAVGSVGTRPRARTYP